MQIQYDEEDGRPYITVDNGEGGTKKLRGEAMEDWLNNNPEEQPAPEPAPPTQPLFRDYVYGGEPSNEPKVNPFFQPPELGGGTAPEEQPIVVSEPPPPPPEPTPVGGLASILPPVSTPQPVQEDTSRFKKDEDGNVIVRQEEDGNGRSYRIVASDSDSGFGKEYIEPIAPVVEPTLQIAPEPTPVGGLSSLITAPIITPSGHEDETGTYVGDSPTADVMPRSTDSDTGGTPIGGTAPFADVVRMTDDVPNDFVSTPIGGTAPDVAPVGGLTSLLPSAPEVPAYKDPATLIPIQPEIQYDADNDKKYIEVDNGEGGTKKISGELMDEYLASNKQPEPAITRSIEPTPEVSPATDIPKIASTVVTSIDPATEPSIAPPPNPPSVVEPVTPENKVLLSDGNVLNNSAGGRGQATLNILADGEDKPSVEEVQKADVLGLAKDKIFSELDDDGNTKLYTIGTDEDAGGKNYSSSAIKNAVNEAYQNWNTNLESATKVYGAGKADWTYEDVYNGLGARGNFDINNLWGGSKSPPRITDWAHIGPTQKEATFIAGQTRDDLWNIQQDLSNKGVKPAKNPDQIALELYKETLGDKGSEYGYGLGGNTMALAENIKQRYLNQPEITAANGPKYELTQEKYDQINDWGKRHEAEVPQVIEQLKEAQKDANRMTFGDFLPIIFMSAATAGMGSAMAPMFAPMLTGMGVSAATAATAAPIIANATLNAFRGMNEGEDFGKAFLTSGVTQYVGGELFNQAGGVVSDMVSAGIPEEAAKAVARSVIGAVKAGLTGEDVGTEALKAGASSLASSFTGDLTSTSRDIDSQIGVGTNEASALDSFKDFVANNPIADKAIKMATNAGAVALASGKDVGTAIENALIRVGVSSGLDETGMNSDIARTIAPVISASLTGGNVEGAAMNSLTNTIARKGSEAIREEADKIPVSETIDDFKDSIKLPDIEAPVGALTATKESDTPVTDSNVATSFPTLGTTGKSALTDIARQVTKRPVAPKIGALGAISKVPKLAAPRVNVSKLIPLKKSAPPKTLASTANLKAVTGNISGLLKKTG